MDNEKLLDWTVPLFKVANWVVQLYDHGLYVQYLCLLHVLMWSTLSTLNYNIDKLLDLGNNINPLRRRNTLLLFLTWNPDFVNTPQTPEEFYHQHWMDSLDQNRQTMKVFIVKCTRPINQQLDGVLCSLSMSKMVDLGWLSKGIVGMEVCVIPIIIFFQI